MTVIIASPEPTATPPAYVLPPAVAALAGRTISVEEVGDVPELAKFPGLTMADERVIVERHAGRFVCHHGVEFGDRLTQMGSNIETAARALVVALTSRSETADYRYVEAPEARIDVRPEPDPTQPAFVMPDTLPTADVLALLAEIRDALTVPHAAGGFQTERGWLFADRAAEVNGVVANILKGRVDGQVITARWWAEHLRSRVAVTPATYPTYDQAAEYGETPAGVTR